MATSETFSDRFAKQRDLVPAHRLASLAVTVIGVGAVGRQVALQLAALGVRQLQLVDFDRVDATNITSQGYLDADVGQPKVAATRCAVLGLDPTIHVEVVDDRFRPQRAVGQVVFCCVDSIEARGAIWRAAGRRAEFWADGRMLGETIRVLAVGDDVGKLHYPTTLFTAADAHTGQCTARGTNYTAHVAAGLMVHQFVRWLRGQPLDMDLMLNLLASELTIPGDARLFA
jgi:sulfur carrier protein ThiS adenylyltransferase